MTDDKDLQQLENLENHWSEPHSWGDQQSREEENIMYGDSQELIIGLLTFHIDVRDFNSDKIEKEFKEKHFTLFERLSEQGIEVLILRNIKHSGDMGVRSEYVKFE